MMAAKSNITVGRGNYSFETPIASKKTTTTKNGHTRYTLLNSLFTKQMSVKEKLGDPVFLVFLFSNLKTNKKVKKESFAKRKTFLKPRPETTIKLDSACSIL